MVPVAQDMAILAPVDVAQARFDGRLTGTDVGVEVFFQVLAVRAMLIANDVGDVRTKHKLNLRQRPDESVAQRLVCVVHGTDLIERGASPEVVIAEVRGLLEVPRVA